MAFPEKPTKPEWIEEFNQELLTPAAEPVAVDDETEVLENTSTDASEIHDDTYEQLPRNAPEPPQAEINWVGRALEKQERIRSERESQLEVFETETGRCVSSNLTQTPLDTTDEFTTEAMAPEAGSITKYRPTRIVAGLVICLSLVFFFKIP